MTVGISEFGSELKKEAAAIRFVAARAVLDLPDSLEAGASTAHDSLESIGQAIDDLGGTVRALLLALDPPDIEPDLTPAWQASRWKEASGQHVDYDQRPDIFRYDAFHRQGNYKICNCPCPFRPYRKLEG